MDEDWESDISEGTGADFNPRVMSPEGLDEYQVVAPLMDRGELSGSSMESRLSTGSFPDPKYAASPLSSLGSPKSEGDFMRHRSYNEQPQNSFLSPDTAALSRESSAGLPLFNIEKDGDPKIKWFMYYDFIVTKTDAYYQLQPGYLPTNNFPPRINSEKIIVNNEKRNPCGVPNCKAKPFTRHYDLERHFKTIHQDDNEQSKEVQMNCDYKRCKHTDPFRKDHCREHYREYHSEDLIKRGQPKNSKSKHGKKRPETVEEFMASRIKNLNLKWWRCSRCVQRVHVNPNGYTCPNCNNACEPERVDWRENARESANIGRAVDSTSVFRSAPLDYATGCGQCKNAWLPDENDDSLWVSCPRCRPGIRETTRSA